MTTPGDIPPVHWPPPSLTIQPSRPFYQQIDFWLGFIGGFVVNGLTWVVIPPHRLTSGEGPAFMVVLSICGGNTLALMIAAIVRRRFGDGLVCGFIAFLISIAVVSAFHLRASW